MVNTSVAVESQPAALPPTNVVSYLPLAVYVFPFQAYEVQFETVVDDDVGCLIVNTNLANESQPTAFVPVHILVPLVV